MASMLRIARSRIRVPSLPSTIAKKFLVDLCFGSNPPKLQKIENAIGSGTLYQGDYKLENEVITVSIYGGFMFTYPPNLNSKVQAAKKEIIRPSLGGALKQMESLKVDSSTVHLPSLVSCMVMNRFTGCTPKGKIGEVIFDSNLSIYLKNRWTPNDDYLRRVVGLTYLYSMEVAEENELNSLSLTDGESAGSIDEYLYMGMVTMK